MVGMGSDRTVSPEGARRSVRLVWSWSWAVLTWLTFVSVTVLTMSMWIMEPGYAETTPVTDLSFFVLGAMIAAGFTSQIRRHPPAAGVVQALLASATLAAAGLLGSRIEPAVGGVVLTGAAVVSWVLHPHPRQLLRSHGSRRGLGAGLVLVATAAGIAYAAMALGAARSAEASCFLGQCAHGDRLAELAATALAVPVLAALATSRIDGWRLPLWSAGLGAITVGAASLILTDVFGSLGVLGASAALAWGLVVIALGERSRRTVGSARGRHGSAPAGPPLRSPPTPGR